MRPTCSRTVFGRVAPTPAGLYKRGASCACDAEAIKQSSPTKRPSRCQAARRSTYVSLVRAASEGLGVQALDRDLGWKYPAVFHTEWPAANGMASGFGAGRIRHIGCRILYVQEALKSGRFHLEKVAGTGNPTDLLKNPYSAADLVAPLARVGATLVRRDVFG